MKPELLKKLEALGFKTFSGNYNLNLIGIRSKKQVPNKFKDRFIIIYEENGHWHQLEFPFTSLPGHYYLTNPSRVTGTAVLIHNKQYRSCWKLGLHRGKYEALTQVGEMSVWRDNNKDSIADFDGPVETGYFGINCHRASEYRQSESVDRWSAGCQVLANPSHFAVLINLVKQQIKSGYGDTCSYILVQEEYLNKPPEEKEQCQEKVLESPSKSRKRSSPSSPQRSKKSKKQSKPRATGAAKSRKKSAKKSQQSFLCQLCQLCMKRS